MSAAKESTAAARARGTTPVVTSTVETTPSRSVDPAASVAQLASNTSPPKASDADKTCAAAGLLERWPGSAAALLAQTMGCPDASKENSNQGRKFPVTGPLRGCSQSDLGMSPSMLNLLQSGAFMHTHQPSLLSAPQGQNAAGGLMSQGCSSGSLSAAEAAALPTHLSNFPGSDFWGMSALTAASATSPPFLTNAAAASLLSAASVESGSLGCCFPDKLPSMPTREQQQRGRHPQQQRQQQQQLLSSQPPQHQASCTPQDQQLLSISPLLMMIPPGGSGSEASASGGRVMGAAGEEAQQPPGVVPGGAQGVVSRESLPKVVGVRYDKVNKTWRASWYDPQSKRRVERKFSVNKLGFINAYNLATECRKLQEKKLGLRDRSGRKQNQQQSELPAGGAIQQIPSPNARAALTGTSLPRFDLHSSSAAAAAWEATASTVSPHMDLSLLGPSLKAFNSSSSSSSLSMPPSQSAALLPMESLLSLTDHQHQQQLQQHHQLQQQHQLHQQQQLQQQACLRQQLGETTSESQQLQHLSSSSDPRSVSSVRGASDSSYLTRSVARAPYGERHMEKTGASGATLGGTSMLSGSLSGLPQQLFDLTASRQQQQQQHHRNEEYAAHHAAMIRRSFQAFERGNPFFPTNTSGTCEQLSHSSSQRDGSARDARIYYPYPTGGHNATMERPAESPTTPRGTLRSSEGGVQRSTPVSGTRGKGERVAPTQAAEYTGNTANSKAREQNKSLTEAVSHDSSPLLRAANHPSLLAERTLRGEKRKLEQTTPQQQRRTTARMSAGSVHSPSSMSETSAVSQQQEKQHHVAQQGQQRANEDGQRKGELRSYDNSETAAESENRTSVSYGCDMLQTEAARQSLQCQDEGAFTAHGEETGRGIVAESRRVVAFPSESDSQTSNVIPHNSEALAYKLRNRRTEGNGKGRRSPHSDNNSQTPASSGIMRTALCDNRGENWKAQDELSACGRHEAFVDQSARAAAAGATYTCASCGDGRTHQHQCAHRTNFPDSECLAEPANVESLPSPTGHSHTNVVAKDGRNSRVLAEPLSDQRKASCNRHQDAETQRCHSGEQIEETPERDTSSVTGNEYDGLCRSDRQSNNRNLESQQQCLRNNTLPARQQAGGMSAVVRSQERGRDSMQKGEEGAPSGVVDAGVQQSYSANAANPLPRRKKQGALLSPASFFAPSSPLGNSSFSLAAYAVASAANARETAGHASRRSSLSSFPDYFASDRVRYEREGVISPGCHNTMECSCGQAYPVMQDDGGGAAVVTRCRGGWCGCRVRCGYKGQFLQKPVRRGWQQLTELKKEICGMPAQGNTLSIVARNEAKRFASLRLPKPVSWLHHPSAKEKCGEDEDLHASKWRKGACWLPEGASASTEDADASASTSLTDCSKTTESPGKTVLETCTAVGREGELLVKRGKSLPQRNGSKEVLALVKELLLLLLQSLQEALTSLCRRRGAPGHAQRELSPHADRGFNKATPGLGWERSSKPRPSSDEAPSEIADSSSNSSTCDSDDTATETSSSGGTSSITNKEAVDCVAAVERHTRHVRNAGKLDELALYTNLFQACIRTRLVPTELPPLQLLSLLRQLMKAQLVEVSRSSQAPNEQESPQQSYSRSASSERSDEDIDRSSAHEENASSMLDKAVTDSSNKGDSCEGDIDTSLGERTSRVEDEDADGSQNEERSSPRCRSHKRNTACSGLLDEERAAPGRSHRLNEDVRAIVYGSARLPATENMNSGKSYKMTAQASKGRRASLGKLSRSDQTKKNVSSSCAPEEGVYLEASYAEDASSQESHHDRKVEDSGYTGETADPSEKRSSLADETSERIATHGSPRRYSRPRMQVFHDYNTRSRSDGHRQGKEEDCSRGGYVRAGEGSVRESKGRVAPCGSFERTYAALESENDLHNASELQQPVPGAATVGTEYTTRQRLLSAENCSSAPITSEEPPPQKAFNDDRTSPRFFSDRKIAESRLALLASEILEDHEDTLIMRRMSGATSDGRTNSESARTLISSLKLPISAADCEDTNGVRRERAKMDDSVAYGEDEEQQAAAGGVMTPLELQDDLRRMSRRTYSRGSLTARTTTASPTTQKACGTADFDESLDIVERNTPETDAEIRASGSEKPAIQTACTSESAPQVEERVQGTPTRRVGTFRGAGDCGGATEEAGRAEDEDASNTRSTYSNSGFGLRAQPREDSLAELLL